MMRAGLFQKKGGALHPADGAARQIVAELDEGAQALMQRRYPRNMAQHRAFFALLDEVVEATGRWPSTDALWWDLSLALRRGAAVVSPTTGYVRWQPDSRAVGSMSAADFSRLFDETKRLLATWGALPAGSEI